MRQALRYRSYLLLWLTQLVSGVGDVLYTIGVMVTIFERTGSTLQTAGAMIATMLPPFALGPFAGAIVDRYPRQRVLLVMDLVRALLLAGLLLLIRNVGFNLWGIYLIVGGLAAASAFYKPARQAIIPSLVPKQLVVPANSLILTTTQATYALGFLLGGFLVLWLSLSSFILLNMVSFVVAALLTTLIRTGSTAASTTVAAPSLWYAIRTGAVYLRRHRLARPLVVMEVLEHIPHGIWTSALMLAFVTEALGGTVTDWGYQNGAYFGAQIIGAVLAGLLANFLARRAGRVVVVNAFLNGLLTLVYAISPTNLFATVIAFTFGPPMALRDVAQDSLLQTSVDSQFLGRIYAIRNMGLSVAFMLAGIFFAWLADVIPVRWIYGIGGLLYLGTAVYALANPPLRQAAIRAEPALTAPTLSEAPIPTTAATD